MRWKFVFLGMMCVCIYSLTNLRDLATPYLPKKIVTTAPRRFFVLATVVCVSIALRIRVPKLLVHL